VLQTERGLQVELEGRPIELVMTPRDWDDMPVVWGGYPTNETLDQVRSQPEGVPYLVYNGQYELEPCATPEIPPDPEVVRLQELAAQYPDGVIPGLGWYAYRRDGSRKPARKPDEPGV
jgi:hypothetical protein